MNLDNLRKIAYIVPRLPRQVVIELTNVCNLDCPMCPRKMFDRPNEHMDFEVYKKIVDRLEGVEEIALIGYGEPLLYPKLIEAIEYGKRLDYKVTLVTNGFPLTDKKVFDDLLHSNLDEIRFSIDAVNHEGHGHILNKEVIEAIERFKKEHDQIRLHQRQGITKELKRIKMIISPVVAYWNAEYIIPLIQWAEKHRFDQVDLAHFNEYGNLESGLSSWAEMCLYEDVGALTKKNQSNFTI